MGSAEDRRTEPEQSLAKGEVDIVVGGAVGAGEEIEEEIEEETEEETEGETEGETEEEIEAEIGAETELESDALDHFHVHLLHCSKLESTAFGLEGTARRLMLEAPRNAPGYYSSRTS